VKFELSEFDLCILRAALLNYIVRQREAIAQEGRARNDVEALNVLEGARRLHQQFHDSIRNNLAGYGGAADP
jgi:hypothetical protein